MYVGSPPVVGNLHSALDAEDEDVVGLEARDDVSLSAGVADARSDMRVDRADAIVKDDCVASEVIRHIVQEDALAGDVDLHVRYHWRVDVVA